MGTRSSPKRRVQHPVDDDTMLKYLLSELEVRVDALTTQVDDGKKKEILVGVRQDLQNFREKHAEKRGNSSELAWNDAYRLERRLALIEPSETLVDEIQRRLDEAEDGGVLTIRRFRERFQLLLQKISAQPDGSYVYQ
jgi:hypothetical protein